MSDQNPPPRPGNYERSWNDPPLFSYGSSNQNLENAKKPGGSRLNKRVEFPSSSMNSGNTVAFLHAESKGTPSCPPMCPPSIPNASNMLPPPLNSCTNQPLSDLNSTKPLQMLPFDYKNTSNPNKPQVEYNNQDPNLHESETDISNVAANYDKIIEKLECDIDKKKLTDVKKRIDMMTNKWKSGAFNPQIHKGMDRMAICLLIALVSI